MKNLILPLVIVLMVAAAFSCPAMIASANETDETMFVGKGETQLDAEGDAHAQARGYYRPFNYQVLKKEFQWKKQELLWYCYLTTDGPI